MSAPSDRGEAVLVTGGAGFIGSNLVDRLVAAGHRVRVLDDFSTGRRENLAHHAGRVEVVVGDLRRSATCVRACRGIELVFHLGALGSVPRSMDDPAESIAVNVSGTANLFAAAAASGRVRRVVYASSSSVYGDSSASPKREGEEGSPLSPYALSKWMDEELGALFSTRFGLETVGLRYFNVYGPRQDPAGAYAAVIPSFFASLVAGHPATIHGDGRQSRDFTWVGDAVAANLAAAAAPAAATGRAYNIGSGESSTLLELEREVRALVGGGPEPRFEPVRPGDVRHSLAATDDAAEALGFRARTSLREGLAASLEYYRRICGGAGASVVAAGG
jgi:nucleoside-diphosphate-sugar epimerase